MIELCVFSLLFYGHTQPHALLPSRQTQKRKSHWRLMNKHTSQHYLQSILCFFCRLSTPLTFPCYHIFSALCCDFTSQPRARQELVNAHFKFSALIVSHQLFEVQIVCPTSVKDSMALIRMQILVTIFYYWLIYGYRFDSLICALKDGDRI